MDGFNFVTKIVIKYCFTCRGQSSGIAIAHCSLDIDRRFGADNLKSRIAFLVYIVNQKSSKCFRAYDVEFSYTQDCLGLNAIE
jgi:hypothetical protein